MADEDGDVVTMDMDPVETRPEGRVSPRVARITFLALAGVAVLALAVAILAVVLAPANAIGMLVTALVVLAIVVVAEIVLLLVARPKAS
ncbi:MAG TPA: hypothetical protein VM370_11390 [Candidatus Thermoplasmatota archaeon]|nr:hypothetical protein [Candidatus Thermoplasmatota archaeon]